MRYRARGPVTQHFRLSTGSPMTITSVRAVDTETARPFTIVRQSERSYVGLAAEQLPGNTRFRCRSTAFVRRCHAVVWRIRLTLNRQKKTARGRIAMCIQLKMVVYIINGKTGRHQDVNPSIALKWRSHYDRRRPTG